VPVVLIHYSPNKMDRDKNNAFNEVIGKLDIFCNYVSHTPRPIMNMFQSNDTSKFSVTKASSDPISLQTWTYRRH